MRTPSSAKAAEAAQLTAAITALTNIHRADFSLASRPAAPAPALPEVAEVHRRHTAAALTGVSIFRRAERKQARARAAQAAEQELTAARLNAETAWAQDQAQLDHLWQALCANDPDVVLATLTEAFEDNAAPAAPLSVTGAEVAIAVLAPPESAVPDKSVGTTAAGNLSVRKMAKTERAGLYTAAVMGHVLVTIREAFAVAPSLDQTRVVVMRPATLDAYAKPTLECLLAGRWTRAALAHVAWAHADAPTITTQTAAELLINLRAGKELRAVDLSSEPALADLLSHVDVDDLQHTR